MSVRHLAIQPPVQDSAVVRRQRAACSALPAPRASAASAHRPNHARASAAVPTATLLAAVASGDGCAPEAVHARHEADFGTGGALIDVNVIDLECVHGEDVSMRRPGRRGGAPVLMGPKIGQRLGGAPRGKPP